MIQDPKQVVAAGYDKVADPYLARFGHSKIRTKWLDKLIHHLPQQAGRVLDLGCGAGIPVARRLSDAGHHVVGVDSSMEQVRRARHNVPKATFLHADMCEVSFEADAFDAVAAFYSFTHVPVKEQPTLMAKVASWLRTGGVLVASVANDAAAQEWTGEWLGAPMFFGHCGIADTLKSLAQADLHIIESTVDRQDDEDAAFRWILASKLSSGPKARGRRTAAVGQKAHSPP